MGRGGLSLEVKRRGREDDHLPPPSAEVRIPWSYTFSPPYVLNTSVILLRVVFPGICLGRYVGSSKINGTLLYKKLLTTFIFIT
jgi:hypothetical protein